MTFGVTLAAKPSETSLDKLNTLYGALIGDAVGVPYEFKDPLELPDRKKIDMTPPEVDQLGRKFFRTYGMPDGTWSDDGALLLCLLESLLQSKDDAVWSKAFAGNAINWRWNGYMAVGGNVFDIGMQTACALSEIEEQGIDPLQRTDGDWASGNGALMRGLAPALVASSEEEAVRIGGTHSIVTHATEDSIAACKVYAAVSYRLLNGEDFEKALGECLALYGSPKLVSYANDEVNGRGWVIDSFWSAVWAVRQGKDYRSIIQHAISLGNDTDTTACIAGGWAGSMYKVPDEWLHKLRGQDLLAPFVKALSAG